MRLDGATDSCCVGSVYIYCSRNVDTYYVTLILGKYNDLTTSI